MSSEISPALGERDYPVVIAGGGLVGLTTSMFLAQHGVPSLVIERIRGGSPLPRAAHFHLRTIELFRLAGIEDEVRRESEKEFLPEGAIVAMDCLAGRKLADIIPSLNVGVDDMLSPCRRLFVSQPSLEKILRRQAKKAGAHVMEGCEVVDVAQESDGITATVRILDTGAERRLRAQYLVGADGAHSKVREALGIPLDGRGVFSNSITIYFTADLWPYLGNKPLSVIYLNNPMFGGFIRVERHCQYGFLAVNTVGDPNSNPDVANAAKDVSEARLIEFVRAGVGVPDLPVKIDGVARWRATSDVARRFQDGRIALVGDAAHLMPPNGGFGGNTGIQDAHNLAWKLALVLKGVAGTDLVATYDAERRPVGKFTVEQAYSRYVTRTATYLGATDYEPVAHDFNVELGYLYRSPAIVAEDDDPAVHADPRQTFGRPCSRAPHVWLERDGRRISTLDLFGRAFVLLAGPQGNAWTAASRKAAAGLPGLELDSYVAGGAQLRDPDGRFGDAYGLSANGAALVRPDGFVAWRMRELANDPAAALSQALRQVLMTA
jgi:2-polyprenyl-6-methoxyphenol hydroxylase-like FAD-dependent oxidoreductase